MINFDDWNENRTEHNSKWPYIPEYPCKILIIGGFRSGKTNKLLNWINDQTDILMKYICMQKAHMKQNINF